MQRPSTNTVRTEREALARVKDLHPQPRLVVEERPDLRFVSIEFPIRGSVHFPVLGFYAISMQVSGTAYLHEGSWRPGHVRAPAGSVFVQAIHSAVEYVWRSRHVSWALCIDAADVEEAARDSGLLTSPQRIEIISRSNHDETAAHMLRALGAEAAAGSHPGQKLACSALRQAMALHMLSSYGAFPAVRRGTRRALSPAALKKAITYLEENLARDCSLEELAAETGVSRYRVSQEFRCATGETPAGYVNRVRVERAKSSLSDERSEPEQVARSLGFADWSSLRRVFQRVTGVYPEDFVRRRGTCPGWCRPSSEKPS